MGNLVPFLIALPFLVAGLVLYQVEKPWEPLPLICLALFPIVGWLCVNTFGLYQNDAMRSELARILGRESGTVSQRVVFVGLADPAYRSVLDPHERVAFLIFYPEKLVFYGETLKREVLRSELLSVDTKPSMHSLLFLGGWIRLSLADSQILIEPREHASLLANRKFAKQLKAEIVEWRKTESPGDNSPSDSMRL